MVSSSGIKFLFFKIYCTESISAYTRTSYKIVPLTNLNKFLHSDTSGTEVNISTNVNNGSEKL